MTDLFSLMIPPAGMHFVCGLGCTYSADDLGVDRMSGALGICLNSATYRDFLEGKMFRLYVQHGNVPETARQFIVSKKPEKGCLHAKLYLLQYQEADTVECPKALLRCIVSSGNLTQNDELNVCFCAEGAPVAGSNSVFGACVSDFLNGLGDSLPCALQCLMELAKCTDFEHTDHASFSTVNETFFKKMAAEAASAKRVLVISPFLHNDILDKLLPSNATRTLVSRPDQLNSIFGSHSSTLNGVECRILAKALGASEEDDSDHVSDDVSDDLLLNCLHAKFYAFQNDKETIVYLGSANATRAAFHENIEVLVRYTTPEDIISKIQNMFAAYMPCDPGPGEKEQKTFERNCLKILNSWEDSRYGVDAATIPEGYTLRLDPASPTVSPGVWMRTNCYTHTAVLTISAATDREELQSSYTLLIAGKAREIDSATLNQSQETALYQRWKSAISSPLRAGSSSKEGKNPHSDHVPAFKPATLENLLHTCVRNAAKEPSAGHCSKLYRALYEDRSQADEDLRPVLDQALEALLDLQEGCDLQ